MKANTCLGVVVALWTVGACSAPANRAVSQGQLPRTVPAAVEPSSVAESKAATADAVSAPARTRVADGGAADAEVQPSSSSEPKAAPAAPSTDDRSVSWPRTVDGSSETVVAVVGGQAIPLTDLVSKWIMRDPNGVRAILDDLLLSRIVALESAALNIQLPPGAIGDEVARRLAGLEASAREIGAPSLEAYVKLRLGLDLATLRSELENEAAIDLLAPRCVRAWILASDRRDIRAIAVDDREAADQVQARLARGDDFAELAREFSTDPSKDIGGQMPPVVRADQALSRTAFSTEVGQVAGPIDDGKGFMFVKVEGAPEPLEGGWAAVGERVEADLADRPIEDPEFWQWREAMFLRYDIDISPFLELASR